MRLHALLLLTVPGMLWLVNIHRTFSCRLSVLCGLLVSLIAVLRTSAQPPPNAVLAFGQCTASVEARLLDHHGSPGAFLIIDSQEEVRLHRGELIMEQLSPAEQPAGALLHRWRATAFAPGATVVQFEQMLRNVSAYPQLFAPQVVAAREQTLESNHLHAEMRMRQKHVMTVVIDASYDVNFGQLDRLDGFSTSRSTRINEIVAADTGHERALTPTEEHGFLWMLNTYWTYQQRAGGLYIQIETVSLSRSVPIGLGWVLRPYVTSVPRESLEFTLRSAVDAVRK